MAAQKFFIYILVGVVTAAIDVGLMQFLFFIGIHYLISTTVGFAAGLFVNFLLHTRVTFGVPYSHTSLARYIAVVAANCILTLLAVEIFHSWTGTPLLGKVLSLPLVALNGFLLSKYWIYRTVGAKKQ